MVQQSKSISLILIASFAVGICVAQKPENNSEQNYRAVHWGLDEGISNGIVGSMIQDINGFLWVATDFGLNRFDGSTFKKYYADKNKGNKTIVGNGVHGLVEDSLHNMWIGTGNGLSRYDIKADTFRNIPTSKLIIPFWATKNEIFTLAYTGDQEMLIRTYDVRSFLAKDVGKIVHTDSLGYAMSDLYPIYDAASNSVWMEKGFRSWPGGGLMQISLTDGTKKTYTWECYRKIPDHSHWSEGMRYDHKRNSIWISSPDGLMEFTLSDRKFHRVEAMKEMLRERNSGSRAGIDIDSKGRVWMGTFPKGIIIFDPESNSITVPFPEDSATQEKVSDANLAIYCGRNGIVWSGYYYRKGIYQLIPLSSSITRFQVKAGQCIKGYNGNLWLGTDDGIKIFDPHSRSLGVLPEKLFSGINTDFVFPVNVDNSSKKAWVHAKNGPFQMDLNTNRSYPVAIEDSSGRYLPHDSLKFDQPYGLISYPFKNGLLMLATFSNRQAILVTNNEQPIARKIIDLPPFSIQRFGVCTDDNHLIFLKTERGATNLTYSYVIGKWNRTPNPLDSIQWRKIVFNKSDNTFWALTETEILHYDKNFKLIRKYTQEDGLPEIGIGGIVPDKNGDLWFNTERSLFHLSLTTEKIVMLSEKDGFFARDLDGIHGERVDDGNIYFVVPREGSLYRIDPDKLKSSPSSFPYLQSLQINQHAFPLVTGINAVNQLSLQYFENKIELETGTIDFYSKGKNSIRYKLEANGKTATWQYAPAYYTIRYEGLPPGKYKLILQAANAGNEFNGPAKSLLINITPAFWNTWWFRVIAFLFLVDLIYAFIQWRTRQRFRLRLERSENARQLAELQQQKIELEMQALRAQMNPHFIFNSLNSINRFILQNNRQQASEYLTKFSKLVRMILQNSQTPLISMESELECLKLYLEMEALRFNYHFSYKISVPKELEIEMLKVPPLIIQPYAENAIWHGLMQKEENGQLDIEVSQEKDYLLLKITDDGVGRKKAAELASKSATMHKSMGLRITEHRITMLQSSNRNDSPVAINDLVTADGRAAGTEVTIKIPILYG